MRGIWIAFSIMSPKELQQKKHELEAQLSDPEVLRNGARVKELSVELGRVEKCIQEAARSGDAASGTERVIVDSCRHRRRGGGDLRRRTLSYVYGIREQAPLAHRSH